MNPDGPLGQEGQGGAAPSAGAGTDPGAQSRPDGGDDPGSFWRRHGRWALVAAGLVAVLAWLTWDDGPWTPVLLYVVVLAVAYRFLSTTDRISEGVRENAVFLVAGVGLLGLLWMMMGMNTGAMVSILITVLIYALFALGLNLQFGYTGIINFGHVAFLGIGAYTVALLTRPTQGLRDDLPWIPEPALLQEPAVALAAVALSAVFVFLVAGLLASVAIERVLARLAAPSARRRRAEVAAGLVAGVAAAVAVLVVVPYPLTPMWQMTFFLAGATLLGMLLASLAGLLLGLPTLRLRADYLAIVTIGAAEILRRVWLNEQDHTRGPLGVSVRRNERPFSTEYGEWGWPSRFQEALGVASEYAVVLVVLLVVAVAFVYACYQILSRSPYGRALRAVREDEDLAAALGKNVFAYKLQVLAIGGAVAALAGAFLLWQQLSVEPQTFHPLITFYAWIIVVVGGAGNNKGTILGAVVLWTFFESTRFLDLSGALGITDPQVGALRVALIGLLLILLMQFKPEGILGKREELVLEK